MTYVLVECSFCRARSSNQRPGDGCHTCLRGFMREVDV